MECVRFLVEQRGAEVNQRDRGRGWTPLHRAARMAHHTHAPYLAVFEYLLQHGADAGLLTTIGWPDLDTVRADCRSIPALQPTPSVDRQHMRGILDRSLPCFARSLQPIHSSVAAASV